VSNIVQVDKEMLNTISQVSDLLAGDMDLYKTKLRGIDFKKIKIALDYLLNDLNLSNTQKAALIANSWRIYYRSKPPTPEEFLSEKYLGAMSDSIYPRVQKWFLEFWDESKPYRNAVLFPFIGAGKLGRNDQLIRIPTGYTTHGKIKVGEEICMPDGSISKVTHVFPQGLRNDLYEVTFSDGRNVIVGASHLWKAFKSTNNKVLDRSRERLDTIESKKPWGVYTTQNIIDDYTKNPRAKWYVPITKPVQHTKRNHILSPYFLGSLLSDENMLDSLSMLGLICTPNDYREELLRLNLIERQRDTLNIPDEYLYDSIKNRISLLQGIIDSKGKVSNKNVISYSTNNLKLSESIATLIRGLGGIAKIKKCKWAHFMKSYQYKLEIKFFTNDFPIFNSVEKQKKVNKNFMKKPYQQGIVQGISIKSILPAEPGEATCIMVDHPDHLYLANDYIVTHNSTLSVLMNLYSTVHLALMRDPKKYFGLAPSANLSYVLCSYNLTKAQETLLEPFINILDNSEFFCRVRTKENMIQSEKEYQKQREITKLFWTTASRNGVSALQFSNGLNYKLASSPSAILGLTIVMGTLTELAFFRDAGKALVLSTPIITPTGYTLMKNIKVGDEVSTPSGNIAFVQGVYPQGITDVYKITFSDGRTIKSCGEHKWRASKAGGNFYDKGTHAFIKGTYVNYWNTITTKEMYDTLHKYRWRIPLTQPVFHKENKHLISPYLLGILIGDGCLRTQVQLSIGNQDHNEMSKIIQSELTPTMRLSHGVNYQHSLIGHIKGQNDYKEELVRLGLFGKLAQDKFIPDSYLYDSISNRISLLQGLLDTDGTAGKNGAIRFSNSSLTLITQVASLVRGLGGLSYLHSPMDRRSIKKNTKSLEYTLSISFPNNTFNCFRLSRKQQRVTNRFINRKIKGRQYLYIVSIEKIDSEETQCITISDPDHLYLAGDYTVTHNSDAYIMKFFNAMKGRVRSRFKDKHDPTGINYWGRTILDSSPNNLESPVDNYCMFEADKTETNYVIKGSQWQWVPEDYEPEELKDTFPIYKGGNGKPPIILNSTEGYSQDEIVMVPRKLHQLFQDDLIQALKDWAGIPQGSLDKLFYDHSKIENIFVPTMKSIYFCLKADTKDSPHNLIWKQVRDDFFVKAGEGWNFYYKPGIPRVFHIDQSISGDMTAISFAHVERKYPAGKGIDLNLDRDLVYVIDMVIPIHPFGGRINLDAIKLFIEDCYIIGSLPIVHGSYDTFQSEPSLQYLDRIGIEMEHISVDETVDPYLFLAQLIEQGNLKTGRNIFLKNNLKSLRVTKRKISETLKIDHTVGDTITPSGADLTWETSLLGFNAKDCSDAVAGAVTAARQFLATDGHSLSQVWDEDTIILTPEQIRRKTLDLIAQFGFSAPS